MRVLSKKNNTRYLLKIKNGIPLEMTRPLWLRLDKMLWIKLWYHLFHSYLFPISLWNWSLVHQWNWVLIPWWTKKGIRMELSRLFCSAYIDILYLYLFGSLWVLNPGPWHLRPQFTHLDFENFSELLHTILRKTSLKFRKPVANVQQ